MNFIRLCIRQPVATFAVVILVALFGVPTISVSTVWPGASPYEIEKEIIERQEDVLKSLPGLDSLESSSYDSLGEVTLTFKVGTELETTLSRVSNKLNEVRSYPDNADRPGISGARSSCLWAMRR